MKLVEASSIESTLRNYLEGKGYSLSPHKKRGETGTDVIAIKDNGKIFVEIIGFQSVPSIRSREFFECFFRAISRDQFLKTGDRLVMALPSRFANGMGRRKSQYGVAWEKIGKTFPYLEIWYVDVENQQVKEHGWINCEVRPEPQRKNTRVRRIWNPRRGTIGALVKELILSNRSFLETRSEVLSKFPDSKFNKDHFRWYKNHSKKLGAFIPEKDR